MALFEYSRWDGSQEFQPQSADKAFDQLSEYCSTTATRSSATSTSSTTTTSPTSSS